jgi:CheY-like chemotaxis protein
VMPNMAISTIAAIRPYWFVWTAQSPLTTARVATPANVTAIPAGQCLEYLRAQTFDCIVLDLSLPDASGFSLLETLSQECGHSFPPVIVYTGHELSADQEQPLSTKKTQQPPQLLLRVCDYVRDNHCLSTDDA